MVDSKVNGVLIYLIGTEQNSISWDSCKLVKFSYDTLFGLTLDFTKVGGLFIYKFMMDSCSSGSIVVGLFWCFLLF